MTYSRIATAGYDTSAIRDIEFGMRVLPRSASEIEIELTIDTSRVRFESIEHRRVAALEIALFAGDRQQDLVGELWERLDLKLTEDSFARAARSGYRHTATLTVTGRPRYVKAVVYDPAADVLGSAVRRMR